MCTGKYTILTGILDYSVKLTEQSLEPAANLISSMFAVDTKSTDVIIRSFSDLKDPFSEYGLIKGGRDLPNISSTLQLSFLKAK